MADAAPEVYRWLPGLSPERQNRVQQIYESLPTGADAADPMAYVTGLVLHRRLRAGGWTLLNPRRGRTLLRLARRVRRHGPPGALVDCGCYHGGSTALLAAGAPDREVWAFDSFAGLPPSSAVDGAASEAWVGGCVGDPARVRDAVARHARLDRLHIREGWFEDTLAPTAQEIGRIALLHCDSDWHDSVRLTLDVLYGSVEPGGYVVVDDYGAWPGARRAVDEFRAAVGDHAPLHSIDYTGVWWRKPDLRQSGVVAVARALMPRFAQTAAVSRRSGRESAPSARRSPAKAIAPPTSGSQNRMSR
jgi:O-methyltransferase